MPNSTSSTTMETDPSNSDSLNQKSESLRSLATGPISSSISKLSGSSRVLPSEKDFHFYYNFDEFRTPINEIRSKSQSMLQQIGSSKHLLGGREITFPKDVEEDSYDWIMNVNDEIMERFDTFMDEFSSSRKAQEEGARGRGVIDEDGFQLVCGKKKKKMKEVVNNGKELGFQHPNVRVAERDEKSVGAKPKVPFHILTIKRPQDEYSILVNNANEPFQHVWLERSEDGSRVIHPLEKLSVLDFVDRNIECSEPQKPPPLESTPCKLVEDVQGLKELASKLSSVNEFAVDLEHNHYRSFQGLTCLMQISTRTEDFVVDTLKLRIHVGPYLREIFKDPTKRKVMHGADRDIVWLQRDFGIYICNLFDTGQASRVLQMERNSLEHLLQHFCGVTANKEYQNAEWRLRPLPDEMIRYARDDTHYLLYIYDLMKIRLISESNNPGNSDDLLLEVYKRSYDVCMQLYEKDLLTDSSYLYIYGVQGANLNAQQLSVVAGLCRWRDTIARTEDESTGYILPNKMLLEIAKQMPITTSKLRRLIRSKHPYVERNLTTVVNIVKHSVQNALSFEAVAEQLKEGHIQVPELHDNGADFSEDHTAGDYSAEVSDGSQPTLSTEESGKPAGHDLNHHNYRGGASSDDTSKNETMRKDGNGGIVNGSQRESLSFPTQKSETNATSMHSEKVAQATVQVLKKPNRAFGALLGSSGSKKKTDLKKEKADKLEQIKSSVNLPFYSFSHMDEHSNHLSKPAPEDPNGVPSTSVSVSVSGHCPNAPTSSTSTEEVPRTQDIPPLPEVQVTEPTSTAKLEDVIFLDNDSLSNDEAPPDSLADHQGTAGSEPVIPDEDNNDDDGEPMSLSDLSASFQKCLQQNQTTERDGGLKDNCWKFKPFDYEAARREVKFGEDAKTKDKSGDNSDDGKIMGKKKGGVADRSKQDGSGLSQGKRRQAFPASGNRSATFR